MVTQFCRKFWKYNNFHLQSHWVLSVCDQVISELCDCVLHRLFLCAWLAKLVLWQVCTVRTGLTQVLRRVLSVCIGQSVPVPSQFLEPRDLEFHSGWSGAADLTTADCWPSISSLARGVASQMCHTSNKCSLPPFISATYCQLVVW